MEPRFGSSFENVRVHTDSNAVQMNRSLGAQAFTHGSDIYYGAGKSPANSDLTAHELTHVVQQTGGVKARSILTAQQECSACQARKDSDEQILQRQINDDENLEAERFKGEPVLESCFDGEKEQYLRKGARGLAVSKIQQALVDFYRSQSFNPLPKFGVDEKYESETVEAVAKFKQDNGISPSDGVVGKQTMTRLDSIFKGESSSPSTTQPPVAQDQPPVEPPLKFVKVVVKSFIAPIGLQIGALPDLNPIDDVLTLPTTTSNDRLRALAKVTDLNFSENPPDENKDKQYRLYSEQTFGVRCFNNRLLNTIAFPLDTDAGKEGFIQAPPLTISNSATKQDGETFEFSWSVKGRPHPAVEPTFQFVHPRTSVFIWHTINGKIECTGSDIQVTASLQDSKFPSDRVYVTQDANTKIIVDHPQDTFSHLWVADSSDDTLVE